MNSLRRLALSASLTALFAFSGCSTVKIEDFEYCNDLGFQGAACDRFLTDKPRRIDKDEWDDLRFGQYCMSGTAYAGIKREIEQLCSSRRDICDYETEQAMRAFFKRMDRLKGSL
jgi:hypothetical protein